MSTYYVIALNRPEDNCEPGIINEHLTPFHSFEEAAAARDEKQFSPHNEGFPFEVISESEALEQGYISEDEATPHSRGRSYYDRERDLW